MTAEMKTAIPLAYSFRHF